MLGRRQALCRSPLAVAGVTGVPAIPYGTYRLDSGDRVRVIVFGQDNLSRVYSVDSSGSVSLPLIGPIRAPALDRHRRRA